MFDNIDTGLAIVSGVFSEGFFVIRTWVLWDNDRNLLVAILVTALTFMGASIGILFATNVSAAYVISAIPGITGCYQSSTSFQLFVPFLLLCVFELGLMILTIIRAIQSWRENQNRLYVALVKHNIFYYTCGFLANIFTSLLLQYSYHTMLYDFQFIILAIFATRMHRDLWLSVNSVDQHAYDYSALVCIPMSDMAPVNSTA
ncbi:uncharacterized protein BJ212DRAFT_1479565 [Suillus subaureus]|uniref:Uncharacterized protein n=1 Tax=Suillus subaureus TaxID=48587 RepID=A0A9P7ED98_9AGAM|nr:uncharacterized protein BJ212DRAFT_1479565 [Suillus subaureus]KAG1818562.1 hypothetical protein BJ212DRAFT_1479565 [Suillus subaureus]